jgi:outer membrane receptor protein involved in Fe transport
LAGVNRPENGYTEGNPFMTFTWFGRQVDVVGDLKKKYFNENSPYGFADGSLYNWNDNYHRNPYWQFYDNPAPDSRDRVVAQLSGTYQFAPWLRGVVRGGADSYRNTTEEHFAKGNIDRASPAYNGGFTYNGSRAREVNIEGLLTARKSVRFVDLTANFGGNQRKNDTYNNAYSTNGILVEGIYNLANAAVTPTVTNSEFHTAVNSMYGSVVATFNRYWTLEGTGRNDWSSTLPKSNASYFYPSVSSSLILSDLLPAITNGGMLSYLKLRGSWARVGSDAGAYQLATVYNGSSRKFGSLALFSLADQSANSQLKPEQTIGSEGGIEASMFHDRLAFDGTYYAKISRNQVLALTTAPATGFSSRVINAGQISNRGFEGSLTARVLRDVKGVSWTSTFNYLRNHNMVDALAPGLAATRLAAQWSSEIQAREGYPYGVLFGYGYLRDSVSGKIITANGLPQRDPVKRVLGNVNPSWTGGWMNDFRYGPWTLSGLLDIRHGGQNFSVGNWFGTQSGVLARSLKGREVDWNNPGLIVDGIDKTTRQANTIRAIAEDYNHSLFNVNEAGIFNTGFVKLREVRLGVDVPSRLASRMRMMSMNVAVVGRNLHTWTSFPNFDPENAANAGNAGQGYDMGALPTMRSVGINLNIVP